MEFTAWITTATERATARAIAKQLGTTHPTIANRIERRDPLLALDIASAYGADPIEGLIACGAITENDVRDYAAAHRLGVESWTDVEIAELIVERLREAESANVYDLPYAADDSETEPEPGDEDFYDGP